MQAAGDKNHVRWVQWGAVIVCVLALEFVCRLGLVRPTTLVAPSVAILAMIEAFADSATLLDFATTLGSVAAATVIAAAIGIAAGLMLHAAPRLRQACEPFIASYYALPLFALYPVLVLVFGVGTRPIIATGVLYAMMSVVIATMAGLDRIPQVLRKTARTHRLGRAATIFRVLMPACAAEMMNGIALALGYAFVAVTASEFLLASHGIGHAIADAYNQFQTARMYGLILGMSLCVVAINAVMRRVALRVAGGAR